LNFIKRVAAAAAAVAAAAPVYSTVTGTTTATLALGAIKSQLRQTLAINYLKIAGIYEQ